MSRFAIVDPQQDADLESLYREIMAAGFASGEQPVNFFTAISPRSDLLEHVWTFCEAVIVEGVLTDALKEMIIVSISRQNNCRYCSVLHRSALEKIGVEPDIVESCAKDPETSQVSEPNRSIIQFALKAAGRPDAVTDADFKHLQGQGLSDEEIAEVLMLAGFTNFINTWSNISGIRPDMDH